jgi:CDP-diacylglycerol---glycerol-3-phosphate 3-phosphatidyltransferase
MLDRRWRAKAEQRLEPIGRALHLVGISADLLTLLGLIAAIGTAVLIANGHLGFAVAGVILTGLPDILDGSVARHSGTASARGAFFDSVCDRAADAALLAGVAWYVRVEDSRAPVLTLAVLAVSMLVSYERAKADALGLSAHGGVMERFERLVLLGVGLALDELVIILWVMLGLTTFTALHRFFMVWRQASPEKGTADMVTRMRTRFVRSHRARRSRPRRVSRVSRRR